MLTGGPASYQTGITDLEVVIEGGAAVLYALSGPSVGISAYALGAGTPQLLDSEQLPAGAGQAAPGQLGRIEGGGETLLVALGRHESAPQSFTLGPGGQLTAAGALAVKDALPGPVVALAALTLGGTEYVYTSHWGAGGIVACRIDASGALSAIGHVGAGQGVQGADIIALETVTVGGQAFLLALSAAHDRLDVYSVAPDGQLSLASSAGSTTGLGIGAPTALAVVELEGAQYAVVAAAGSDSLSVLHIGADGSLTQTDHVIDTTGTRFGGVAALAAVTVGDQVFLVAGGGDDGLSLFSLLPGGRLMHRDTIADGFATGLENVTALALHVQGGTIQVFAASQSEAGITHLVSRITGYTDLKANHLTQVGANAVIDDGAGTVIVLSYRNVADLDASDFIF